MIGIDKTTINNIGIISIDFKKLKEKKDNITIIKEGTTVPLPTDIPGQYEEVNYLKIRDKNMFNVFRFGMKKVGGGKMIVYCMMKLHIRPLRGDNMNPLNISEYKEMLQKIKSYMVTEYGIRLDFSNIGFAEMEINCTFKLDRKFEEYEYLLDRFRDVIPKRYKTKGKFEDDEDIFKELLFFNGSTKLKIYDKKKQLEEVYNKKIDDELMRIEYTFLTSDKVKSVFGSNKVKDMTDEDIQEYVKQGIEKDLFTPLLKYKKEADKELLKIAKEYQKEYPRQWGSKFITESKSLKMTKEVKGETKEGKKLLLIDNQQLKNIVYKVAKDKRTAKKLYKQIECIKQSDGTLNKLQYIQQNIL